MTAILLAKALVFGLFGCAFVLALRRRTAAVRHAFILGELVCMLALPWMSAKLPSRTLPVMLPAVIHPSGRHQSALGARVEAKLPSARRPAIPASDPLRWGYGLWAAGSLLLLARWSVAYASIVRRVRHSSGTGIGEDVREDASAHVPMTAWVGRHVILLPPGWRSWPAERLDHVLRHERAHVDRGDWFGLALSRVACAVYWPNPFTWVLARKLHGLAEEAADDRVVVSGVVPSRYASDLLEIAREMRATHSAMALPMADKAEVARRIEMILTKNKRRGGVSLPSLFLTASVLAALSIPLACLALGPAAKNGPFGSFIQTTRSSWAEDVRLGRTTPATLDDHYVGKLRDGRSIRVVQVAMKEDGKVVAWSPDGTLLPPSKTIKHRMVGKDRQYRHVLVEVDTTAAPSKVNGGLGSGPSTTDEPSEMVFAGGSTMPGSGAGKAYVMSLIELPKNDGSKASFTFGLSDGAFWLMSEFAVADSTTSGQAMEDARLEPAKAPFPWDQWPEHHAKPSVRFTAKLPPGIQTDIQVVAVLKDGEEEEGDGNFGRGYDGDRRLLLDYYFKSRRESIRSIQIRKREAFHAEVIDLALKPRSEATP